MKLFHHSWIAPKFGNKVEETEDAFRIDQIDGNDSGELFVAVSDGASETVFCRAWARSLVDAAKPDWPTLTDDELTGNVKQIRQEFKPMDSGKEYPWFVKEKFITQGSQATLLAASIKEKSEDDSFEIQAVCVGDSCLLLFKQKDHQIYSFPLNHSEQFGVTPVLVSNRPQNVLKFTHMPALSFESGDFLMLCTDAISQWILRCVEQHKSNLIFDTLLELLSPTESVKPSTMPEQKADTTIQQQPVAVKESPEESSEGPWLNRVLSNFRRFWSEEPPGAEPEEPAKESDPGPVESKPDTSIEQTQTIQEEKPADQSESRKDSFGKFLETYRAREGNPRMRNDDATLVFCMPVKGEAKEEQLQEALELLRKHQQTQEFSVSSPISSNSSP